ncbi:MAG: hypothetical protein ACTHY8_06235 [Microbacterium gubbeenense]|uniref:hypothetical protein n=1 Tax=Microbacterium gubbeenense TaxID=159896 RepID=UPI0003F6B256|nr:hypothetical protein [Microbacterium gubbeenense]
MTLEVSQGSVVAVDPDELRAIANRVRGAASLADSALDHIGRANAIQAQVPAEWTIVWADVMTPVQRCEWWQDDAVRLADGLDAAADAYEVIELRVLLQMDGAGDGSESRRLEGILARNPAAGEAADHLWAAWEATSGDGLVENWMGAGVMGAYVMALLVGGIRRFRTTGGRRAGSLGEPGRAARRSGRVPGTSGRFVDMLEQRVGATTAPTGLASSVARIPNGETEAFGEKARVRIDKYAFPTGEERFVVYISGSRGAPWKDGDPFDWGNNVGLYLGEAESEGYDFVLEALERAGAQEGSFVDVNGFSQGTMVAQRIATDSDFRVGHVTTIGAPVRMPVGEDVTSIAIAHDDDPVAALSDGGSPASLGDDDSLLIRRTYDEAATGLREWKVGAHRVSAYEQTARLFEQSGDPRAESVREYYAQLGRASSVESFVYHAPEGGGNGAFSAPPSAVSDAAAASSAGAG